MESKQAALFDAVVKLTPTLQDAQTLSWGVVKKTLLEQDENIFSEPGSRASLKAAAVDIITERIKYMEEDDDDVKESESNSKAVQNNDEADDDVDVDFGSSSSSDSDSSSSSSSRSKKMTMTRTRIARTSCLARRR